MMVWTRIKVDYINHLRSSLLRSYLSLHALQVLTNDLQMKIFVYFSGHWAALFSSDFLEKYISWNTKCVYVHTFFRMVQSPAVQVTLNVLDVFDLSRTVKL